MRRAVKRLVFAVLYALRLTRLAARCNRRNVTILCYHGVTERETRDPRDPFGLHVRRNRFVSQLEHLRRHYRVIALREYLEAREKGMALPRSSVILTFDDGYRNFLTAAAPCLAERGMSASVFLITDWVGMGDDSPRGARWTPTDDDTYLSWAEVHELNESAFLEFGSHTCSHGKLSALVPEAVGRELRRSHAAIVSRGLGNGAVPLAYPFGAYSSSVIAGARAVGYACGLTTDRGVNDGTIDLFRLRRTLIGDDDEVAAFDARVSGLMAWLRPSGS